MKEGVFIPRRDTSSLLNTFAGGRIFPGQHHHSKFDVKEEGGHYHVAFKNVDGTMVSIDAEKTDSLNHDSIFKSLENVSAFFEEGSVGYSPNRKNFDRLKLTIGRLSR